MFPFCISVGKNSNVLLQTYHSQVFTFFSLQIYNKSKLHESNILILSDCVFAVSSSELCDVCVDSVESVQCIMWPGFSVPQTRDPTRCPARRLLWWGSV